MIAANEDRPSLDASGDIPLYRQLYQILRSQIMSGELHPGKQLPSERQLAARYGISRYTVRKATERLLDEGLAYRQRGSGIYVTAFGENPGLHLLGFSEEMERYGLACRNRVEQAETIEANDELAMHLILDRGDPVYALKRVRLMHGNPIGIEQAYLPLDYLPELPNYDFSQVSLYQTLEQEMGIQIDHAEQAIRARPATPEERELLDMEAPGAVLELERETFDKSARVIEYCVCVYHSERYTLSVYLSRH